MHNFTNLKENQAQRIIQKARVANIKYLLYPDRENKGNFCVKVDCSLAAWKQVTGAR